MSKGLLAVIAAFSISVASGATRTSQAQTCPDGFPQAVDYWQANPDSWPLDLVTIGNDELSKQYAIDNILTPDPNGNVEMILAQQLVAALLNIAAGVDAEAIQDYIDQAQSLISDGVDDGGEKKEKFLDTASELESFNNGSTCSLPVELTSFDAQLDGTLVTLRWTTASELDNAGFEVEHRRPEGHAFETVDFVAGHGTTNHISSYSVNIDNLGFGKHTFRLRQIERDGTFSYSHDVEVQIELTDRFALTEAYPNPFNPTTNIRFSLREAGEITLAVYDVVGRHVRTLALGSYTAGSHDVVFTAHNLPSGTYLYQLQTEAGPVTGTLVLLK